MSKPLAEKKRSTINDALKAANLGSFSHYYHSHNYYF